MRLCMRFMQRKKESVLKNKPEEARAAERVMDNQEEVDAKMEELVEEEDKKKT